MNHVILHAGLDPASKLFGMCWIDHSGTALEPIRQSNGAPLFSFVTLRGTKDGKAHRNIRLDQIEDALWDYVRNFPARYFTAINNARAEQGLDLFTWEIGSFCIEQPSDNYHASGAGAKRGDRHDTMFVNGMSYRMAYTVARGYARETLRLYNRSVAIYEVEPSQSSKLLNLRTNAKKWERCSQACTWTGGRYEWPGMELMDAKERMKRSAEGYCVGGRLDGANADALDAFAAAHAGFHFFRSDKLHTLAVQQSKEKQRERKKPTRRAT